MFSQSRSIESLNDRFGSTDVSFECGDGNLPKCKVQNDFGAAEFYLQGAHVTHFQPANHFPVLWLSDCSTFEEGKPIRGGIPICWPWFGAHDRNAEFPQHGFARTAPWSLRSVLKTDFKTEILLGLTHSEKTRRYFAGEFDARYRISVGSQLTVELSVTNTGNQDLKDVGCALHSYFQVSQIDQVEISGLENKPYLDKLDQQLKLQNGPITIDSETDRIYRETADELLLSDEGLNRLLEITGMGSQSTVVWNPWIDKSQRMPDFPDSGYQSMICIETANADTDVRTIAPGETHLISQTVRTRKRKTVCAVSK